MISGLLSTDGSLGTVEEKEAFKAARRLQRRGLVFVDSPQDVSVNEFGLKAAAKPVKLRSVRERRSAPGLRCAGGPLRSLALLHKHPGSGPFPMELAGLEPATSWVRSRFRRLRASPLFVTSLKTSSLAALYP
jgi:hypothetical protein